jgi:hypothetical protein
MDGLHPVDEHGIELVTLAQDAYEAYSAFMGQAEQDVFACVTWHELPLRVHAAWACAVLCVAQRLGREGTLHWTQGLGIDLTPPTD